MKRNLPSGPGPGTGSGPGPGSGTGIKKQERRNTMIDELKKMPAPEQERVMFWINHQFKFFKEDGGKPGLI